ncbi:zinc finger and BTB domain-containing protein 14 isoform X2 [Anabrus simplex]|uniref:zinc finger and BTB domain-containing protein 14 isoform X2 n=1 Tax=Anabrus simplex TaxID=316456 RepID=UPI0034DD5F05
MTEGEQGSADTFSEHFMAQEAEEDGSEEDSSKIMNFVEVKCEPPSPDIDHEEEMPDDFQHQENKTAALIEEEPGQSFFFAEEPPFIKFEPAWSSDTEESIDLGVKEQSQVLAEDLLNEAQSPLESSNNILSTSDTQTCPQEICQVIDDAKPLKCSTCKKTFFGSDQLKAHKLQHSFIRPYSCSICSKSFTQRTILKRHMIIHSADRPHSCTICMRSFTRYDYLKSHLLVHAKEKPLSCDTCGKTFLRLSHLRSHTLRHSGEKPFQCATCGKTFFCSSSLKRHIKKKSHASLST